MAVAGSLYLGWTLGFYFALYTARNPDPSRYGTALLVALAGSTFIGDTAALLVGSRFGRHRFFPAISPQKTLEGAARILISGHTSSVDVGEVNGRVFLNNSSLGLYPTIVREREKTQGLGAGKWPAFVWAAIAAFRRYPFLHVRLIAEGKDFDLRTPFVFVGNNKYVMEGFNIGRREHLDKGQLSVYITNRTGRWGLVRLALRALLGHLREEKDFLALLTNELKIKTKHKRLRVALDGEVDSLEAPLHYRVRTGALRVIVPGEDNN